MKTLIAIVMISASAPAFASLQTSMPDDTLALQPVAQKLANEGAACGQLQDVTITVTDDAGRVLAVGTTKVAPSC